MNVDSYYEIGAGHKICEDYALHGQYNDLYYIIGSDGCSSSDDVDVGARLLCHIAKKQLIELHETRRIFEHKKDDIEKILRTAIVQNCLEVKRSLRLRSSAFDATLWIVIGWEGRCLVFGWGDGVVAIKDKEFRIIEREYKKGAPYYLSYGLNYERDQNYGYEFKGNLTESGDLIERCYLLDDGKYEGGITKKKVEIRQPFVLELDVYELKTVTICSDGVSTYQIDRDSILMTHIVSQMVDYKNLVGTFVERRMLKLKRYYQNRIHIDDVFCATMNFK